MITADKARENMKNYFNNLCLDSKQFKVANEILTAILNEIASSSAVGHSYVDFYYIVDQYTHNKKEKWMHDIIDRDLANNDYSIREYIRGILISRGFSVKKCSITDFSWDIEPMFEIFVEVFW